MELGNAKKLCDVTRAFYERNACSFSDTRKGSWPGWQRCCETIFNAQKCNACHTMLEKFLPEALDEDSGGEGSQNHDSLRSQNDPTSYKVLDVGCGNLRFERFLYSNYPERALSFQLIDSCGELVTPELADIRLKASAVFYECDIISRLFDTSVSPLEAFPTKRDVDLAVSFGFMHHIPGQQFRLRFLEGLIDQVKSHGFVAVSFWMFLNNDHLAKKAQQTHKKALAWFRQHDHDECFPFAKGVSDIVFDSGDYLLGWNNEPDTFRYAHSFTLEEIVDLSEALLPKAHVIDSFNSDGRGGNLNHYLVFQKL